MNRTTNQRPHSISTYSHSTIAKPPMTPKYPHCGSPKVATPKTPDKKKRHGKVRESKKNKETVKRIERWASVKKDGLHICKIGLKSYKDKSLPCAETNTIIVSPAVEGYPSTVDNVLKPPFIPNSLQPTWQARLTQRKAPRTLSNSKR